MALHPLLELCNSSPRAPGAPGLSEAKRHGAAHLHRHLIVNRVRSALRDRPSQE